MRFETHFQSDELRRAAVQFGYKAGSREIVAVRIKQLDGDGTATRTFAAGSGLVDGLLRHAFSLSREYDAGELGWDELWDQY